MMTGSQLRFQSKQTSSLALPKIFAKQQKSAQYPTLVIEKILADHEVPHQQLIGG